MPNIMCPYCKVEQDVEGEQFPDNACDIELVDCQACDSEIAIGWYAVFEATKPPIYASIIAHDRKKQQRRET